jgi:mono/diheme cytochrome c family protein
MKLNRLNLLGLALLLSACETSPPTESKVSLGLSDGPAFAKASCGGCHAVGPHSVSPNPNAPPFPAIVNQEGLTAETLSTWLRDAHNYPSEMKFDLGQAEVDRLVDYMLTMKNPSYRPPPS